MRSSCRGHVQEETDGVVAAEKISRILKVWSYNHAGRAGRHVTERVASYKSELILKKRVVPCVP